MTQRELELFKIAVQYLVMYRNSNPDIGMAPLPDYYIDFVAAQSGVQPNHSERVLLRQTVEDAS